MTFSVKILGANSATPAYGRHHTAQFLQIQNHNFLVDCGEGTQMQLARYKCKTSRIDHIFISHLHGDHYLGLMGLLFTMHLLKRNKTLHLYGPRGLDEIVILQLRHSDSTLNYTIEFHETNPKEQTLILEDKRVEVYSFPLQHRIPCTGFLFKEKPKPIRINKDTLPPNLTLQEIAQLKKGEDIYTADGQVKYRNKDLTKSPRKSRSYAFCSDTIYDETLVKYLKGVDLLYHEATFLDEKEKWATQTYHSTTKQAAQIAKAANVGQLIIGHFSARYRDLSPFIEETKQYFSNSVLAEEGAEFIVQE